MNMEIDIYEMVDAIRLLDPHYMSFRLSKCACGGPSFQQPCPLCGFYPMGNDPGAVERAKQSGVTLESFAHEVEGAGSVALWYSKKSTRNTVAWDQDHEFMARIEKAEVIMQEFEWPAPELIWKYVVEEGRPLPLSDALRPWCIMCKKSSHKPNPSCSTHAREGRLRGKLGIA